MLLLMAVFNFMCTLNYSKEWQLLLTFVKTPKLLLDFNIKIHLHRLNIRGLTINIFTIYCWTSPYKLVILNILT